MKKLNKFLLIGMVTVLSFNALATPLSQMENHANQIQQQITQLKESEAIPKNIGITFKKVAEEEITQSRLKAEALLNISQETCNVNINATEDMKVGFSGSNENREFFKEVTEAKSHKEELLRTEYIVLHEASHCKLYEVKDVFKSGDTAVDTVLNQYYKFSSASYQNSPKGDASLYYMLHENFADTHAFMQMLKENGPTTDVLKTIQQVQIERTEAATQYNTSGMIVHNTNFALKELLKEENINKVMSLQTQGEIQEFALQIANKGLWESVSSNNASHVASPESLENGAQILLANVMRKDIFGQTEKSNISVNWENNKLLEVANDTYKEFKSQHDTSKIKTQEDFTAFYKQHAQQLNEKIVENLGNELNTSYEKGVDIVEVVDSYISSTAKSPILTIQQIKEQGIKDLNSIDSLASRVNSKESIVKNISQIRATNYQTNKNTVKNSL